MCVISSGVSPWVLDRPRRPSRLAAGWSRKQGEPYGSNGGAFRHAREVDARRDAPACGIATAPLESAVAVGRHASDLAPTGTVDVHVLATRRGRAPLQREPDT